MWHRTDLRLADNAAITAAAAAADGRVVGVVVLPEHVAAPVRLTRGRAERYTALPDFVRMSPRRTGHLLQAVDELRSEWQAKGSTLFVIRGDAAASVAAPFTFAMKSAMSTGALSGCRRRDSSN